MYSSYDQYQANGGTLPEDRYNILAKQAGYLIDSATMGRARDAPDSMAEPLADCECALVDSLAAGAFKAGQTGTVKHLTAPCRDSALLYAYSIS